MERYLVTHSLLASWKYALRDNPYEDATTERDPVAEFMQVLRREPTETTEAMQNGIRFEQMVTDLLYAQEHPLLDGTVEIPQIIAEDKWFNAAQQVADLVRGAQLQFVAKSVFRTGNREALLYGRLDALRGGHIYDIKFSKSYDRGKYIDSTQHPMYLKLIPEAVDFTYIISSGTDVWTETYRRDETPDIIQTVAEFFDWLDAQGLGGIYREHWAAK